MKLSFIFILTILIFGCAEVAEISLDSEEPKLVIDGGIDSGEGPYFVTLRLSNPLYNSQPSFVEDAIVTISDNSGNSETLQYEGQGSYKSYFLKGKPEATYHLKVNYKGEIYEAWSTMPEVPTVEEIEVRYFEESLLRGAGYYILIHGLDAKASKGYYRALVYKNDSLYNPLGTDDLLAAISDDRASGINSIKIPFTFLKGDTINIKILKMDKAAYTFYLKLLTSDSDEGLFGQIPANPETNISNGALGLFKAQSVMKKRILIE